MAKTALNVIKNWFKTGLFPTEAQFHAWMDSFWHKDEDIPVEQFSGLQEILDQKVDKISGKGLSTNDFTAEEKQKLDSLEFSIPSQGVDKSLEEYPLLRRMVADKYCTSFRFLGVGEMLGVKKGERGKGEVIILTLEKGAKLKHLEPTQTDDSYPFYFANERDVEVKTDFLPLSFVLFDLTGVGLVWMCLESSFGAEFKSDELFAEPCGFPCYEIETTATLQFKPSELDNYTLPELAGEAEVTRLGDSILLGAGKAYGLLLKHNTDANLNIELPLCESNALQTHVFDIVNGRQFELVGAKSIGLQDDYSRVHELGFQVLDLEAEIYVVCRKINSEKILKNG